jgi:hypothetical protein
MDPKDRPIEDIQAGDEFRKSLLDHADEWKGRAPLWHGWALMDAFLAGIDHARQGLTRDDIESPHPMD